MIDSISSGPICLEVSSRMVSLQTSELVVYLLIFCILFTAVGITPFYEAITLFLETPFSRENKFA